MGIQFNGNTDTISTNDGTLNVTPQTTFGGEVGIAGTLTYEDVTNIDSVGIITARSGIRVGANGIKRETVHLDAGDSGANYLRFTNTGTGNGVADGFNVGINADEHALLWNFEEKDTRFATNNLERLRIDSAGSVNFYGGEGSTDALVVHSEAGGAKIHISNYRGVNDTLDTTRLGVGKNNNALIFMNASGNQVDTFAMGTPDAVPLVFSTSNAERLRIDSSGNVGVGTNVGSDSSGNAQAFTIARTGVNGQVRLILKNEGTGFGNGAGYHQGIDGANVFVENRTSGGYLDFSTNNSGSIASRMRILSDGKVGISSSIPQRPLDVRGEVFANRFTAYSAPTSTYNNQTTGVKYGARGGYTLTLGGTRSSNTNSFTIFDAKDFNNSKYFCLEISFCHAGGGVHGSYRRFAGICNGYTSIVTWNDTGNVNTGGGLGFTISKPDNHTLRCVWNGCSGFADSYTLYCMLHVSNGNSYFSAIDSAFY